MASTKSNSETELKGSVLQENLARGLNAVLPAVAARTRSTLPVLGNVLVRAEPDGLFFVATNLEMGIECRVGANVEQPFAIALPARQLMDWVNALPPDHVELTVNPTTQTAHFACARFQSNFKGTDASKFPVLNTTGEGALFRGLMDPDVFREALGRVLVAAAKDDSQPVLKGVLVQVEEKSATLAAADGFRLAVHQLRLEQTEGKAPPLVIPATALAQLHKLLSKQEAPLEMFLLANGNTALFKMENVALATQLIEGKFPDYAQIVPKNHATRATFSVGEMQNQIRLASVMARENSNKVVIDVCEDADLEGGAIQISAAAAEMGDAQGVMDAVVEGAGLTVACNARYLKEVIETLSYFQQAAMESVSPASPLVFRPRGSEDYVHLIMPMS